MKKKNNKKGFKAPKRNSLTYLILLGIAIFVLLAVFVPLNYVKEYKENKVVPFESELTNLEVEYLDELSGITDFNLVLTCTEYKDISSEEGSNLSSATFKYYVYENGQAVAEGEDESDDINKPKIKNIKIKLAMCASWIKVDQSQTARTLTLYENVEKGEAGARTTTISSLPDLPKKGGLPFINIKSIPLYIYLSYDISIPETGKTITKHFVISLQYEDYIVGAIGGIEK